MGKRKLHNFTYYQCDWTGYPMKHPNCFIPAWTSENKMVKKGNYCNWESVVAHVEMLFTEGNIQNEEKERILDYVSDQVGGPINTKAPHFTELQHIESDSDKSLSVEQYHNACCYETKQIYAVKISETGHTYEVLLDSNDGKIDYKQHLKQPQWDTSFLTNFKYYCKSKLKNKDVCVFYYTDKNGLELNTLASTLFNVQIFGEVLLLQCTKEMSFMPRQRFTNYSVNDFKNTFPSKGKRKSTKCSTSMKEDEYNKVKTEMESSLSDYEKLASSMANLPHSQRAVKMPPFDGKELALLKKHEKDLALEA